MRPAAFYAEARLELRDAVAMYWSSNPRNANRFEQLVRDLLTDIGIGTIRFARYPGTPCRERLVPGYPYSIIYLDDLDAVRVVAVAHHKRRRGYWKSRLSP